MQDHGSGPPVPYMERTRLYYRALGYTNDYAWAHHDARNRKQVWSGSVDRPPATFDTDVAWDKESTHTDDRETFLPIDAARRLVAEGTLGALAPRFHAAPTDYSQQKTMGQDAPEILRRLREDGADAAILTAL